MGKRPRGRPPAGEKDTEQVRDYVQLTIRVPPRIHHLLTAIRTVTNRPQWRIVMEALEQHAARLPAKDRRLIALLMERRQKGGPEIETR
jgi:hypothetical protein